MMGRFRYVDDDDGSDGIPGYRGNQWEFVGDPGDEGAVVKSSNNGYSTNDFVATSQQDDRNPTYIVVQNHPDFENTQGRKRKFPMWIKIAVVAVLVRLTLFSIHRFGPPGPPQRLDGKLVSWEDFASEHMDKMWRSAKALLLETPLYVGGWWISSMSTNMKEWWSTPAACSVQIPVDMQTILGSMIVGQSVAVEILSDSIQAWKRTLPLVLVAAGSTGTGKQTSVSALANSILSCPKSRKTNVVLNGNDYQDMESAKSNFGSQLVEHCQGNSVVLLENVEAVPTTLLDWLLDELTVADSLSSTTWSLHLHCKNTIIVLSTTTLGKRSIASASNEVTLDGPMRASLRLDLEYELKQHTMKLEGKVDAIIPFFLLDHDNLENILGLQLRSVEQEHKNKLWSSLTITTAFAKHVLAPSSSQYVEYVTWRYGETSNGDVRERTFSTTGAQALAPGGPLWTKLNSQIQRCVVPNPLPASRTAFDYRDGHGLLERCDATYGCQEVCRFPV